MKLYDGRGKRFKKLIDPKEIMKENRIKIIEVLPKKARASWYSIWAYTTFVVVLGTGAVGIAMDFAFYILDGTHLRIEGVITMMPYVLMYAFIAGGISVVTGRRWTWKSKAVAIRILAQQGFCPNCGYIIRDTPADSDGCTECSECGYAWRVEPVES